MLVATPKSTTVRADRDGPVSVRPLPPREVGHAVDRVFSGLSGGSRYQRFHGPVPRMTELLRRRLVDVDGHRRAAIVAEVSTDGGGGDPVPVGLVELADAGRGAAEVAIAVVDAWHRRGVGRQLIEAAAALAMRLGYTELRASALPENVAVRGLARALFPQARWRLDGDTVQLTVPIGAAAGTVTDEDVLADLLYRG
jgi:GNAT superfamily N-acetyltransferase